MRHAVSGYNFKKKIWPDYGNKFSPVNLQPFLILLFMQYANTAR
jgi:hypothetical protein